MLSGTCLYKALSSFKLSDWQIKMKRTKDKHLTQIIQKNLNTHTNSKIKVFNTKFCFLRFFSCISYITGRWKFPSGILRTQNFLFCLWVGIKTFYGPYNRNNVEKLKAHSKVVNRFKWRQKRALLNPYGTLHFQETFYLSLLQG